MGAQVSGGEVVKVWLNFRMLHFIYEVILMCVIEMLTYSVTVASCALQ